AFHHDGQAGWAVVHGEGKLVRRKPDDGDIAISFSGVCTGRRRGEEAIVISLEGRWVIRADHNDGVSLFAEAGSYEPIRVLHRGQRGKVRDALGDGMVADLSLGGRPFDDASGLNGPASGRGEERPLEASVGSLIYAVRQRRGRSEDVIGVE